MTDTIEKIDVFCEKAHEYIEYCVQQFKEQIAIYTDIIRTSGLRFVEISNENRHLNDPQIYDRDENYVLSINNSFPIQQMCQYKSYNITKYIMQILTLKKKIDLAKELRQNATLQSDTIAQYVDFDVELGIDYMENGLMSLYKIAKKLFRKLPNTYGLNLPRRNDFEPQQLVANCVSLFCTIKAEELKHL